GIGGRTFDEQLVLVDILLVACIGNRGEQSFGNELGRLLGSELKNRQRVIDFLARDQLAHKLELARRDSDEAASRYGFHGTNSVLPVTPWPLQEPELQARRIVLLRPCDRRRGRGRCESA